MEEQGQEVVEFKHVCKFCKKSFPCGRSLGGHMRSHMINNSFETDEKLNKPAPAAAAAAATTTKPGSEIGYGLRENPRKTWRFADSSEDTSVLPGKFCKDCGKGFQSWKALFGHMRSHSSINNSLEEQEDSWASASDHHHKLVMDSHSDTETAVPSRRKRSRRATRYIPPTATSSSFSFPNNPSSSVSEIEQEQEEVAISLMMLSRDSANWVGFNSVTESSDNNSVFLEAPPSSSFVKLKRQVMVKDEHNFEQKEHHAKAMNKSEILETETELGKNKTVKDQDEVVFSGKYNSSKRSKFECTTCNKTFHSYQALGGHRASHKKIKGCFASRIESSENSIDHPEPSPDLTTTAADSHGGRTTTVSAETSKKSKGHECPICLKVFSSGQALGGHKRSHLVGGSDARTSSQTQTIVIPPKPIPEIRDFLDLNLPAPAEEDGGGAAGGFKPWWVGTSHKHEHLVGMISH